MISSPGMGVQQLAKLTTPRSAPVMRIFSPTRAGCGASRSAVSDSLRASDRATCAGMRLPRPMSCSSASSRG